jgi:small subunit ribosomal protein S9
MSKYTYSVWKRKTASAQVRLYKGTGSSKINDKSLSEYITRKDLFDVLLFPLKLTKNKDNFYFEVKVSGSWESAQVQAIAAWISKALVDAEPSTKAILKEAGLLTRDARKVERKKPGKKKARKSPTWSKR